MAKTTQAKKEKRPSEGFLLGAVADLIPGLGKLVRRLEENPAFKARLEEAEQSAQERFTTGSKQEGVLDFSFSVRPLGGGLGRRAVSAWAPRERERLLQVPKQESGEPSEAPMLEVIKEKNRLRVVGHWPGLSEEIKAEVKGKKLVLSVGDESKEINLPFSAKLLKKAYKNGVLEIILGMEKHGKKRSKKRSKRSK